MAELDHGAKLISGAAGRHLARLAGLECRAWRPVESTLQATTELLADRAFRATVGNSRCVVYFEFYAEWRRDALWNLLGKSGLLSERERLPTQCVLIFLRQREYRALNGTFRAEVEGHPTQQLWFHELRLWEAVPEPWWEGVPALMALYPLCNHGRSGHDAVRHAAEVIEASGEEPARRADCLYLLSVFGHAAYPRLDVASLIGSEAMKESPAYRMAKAEGTREALLDVLSDRFGANDSELIERLNALGNPDELKRLVRVAATCATVDEFRAALPAVPPAPPRSRRTRR